MLHDAVSVLGCEGAELPDLHCCILAFCEPSVLIQGWRLKDVGISTSRAELDTEAIGVRSV